MTSRAVSSRHDFSSAQLMTIRRTVAPDANDMEFDLFMNAARNYGLDPFRKQISIIIFSKNDLKKRKHAIIVGRDGLRAIAQRCGDYRPASEPAQFVTDPDLKGPANPAGLVSCTVKLWKQDNRGDWYPVIGEAYWDEFVPMEQEWAWDEEKGKRLPTGEQKAGGNWSKMPRIMLQKCAEAQALRAGWPDEFGGLYAEEEMDQARYHEMRDITPDADLTPSQRVEKEAIHRRENLLGSKAVLMVMDEAGTLERIPLGEVHGRCEEFLRQNKGDPERIYRWWHQNHASFQEWWAQAPGDALDIKSQVEPHLKAFEETVKQEA